MQASAFNVFAYNAQPGVEIDYATGESRLDGSLESQGAFDASQYAYVLNVKTKRFHKPDCPSVEDMKAANREGFDGSREEAEAARLRPLRQVQPVGACPLDVPPVVSRRSTLILVYNFRHGERAKRHRGA